MALLPKYSDSNQVLAYKAAKNLWDFAVLVDSTLKEPHPMSPINELYYNMALSTKALGQ